MKETVVILDFGSQYSQLIARRVREKNVYSLIVPYNITLSDLKKINPQGIILSGGPASVYEKDSPRCGRHIFELKIPLLGICYGMHIITELLGGKVKHSKQREYGYAELIVDQKIPLLSGINNKNKVWMSHGDKVAALPRGFKISAHTNNSPTAIMADLKNNYYGLQFHPEVGHTAKGNKIIENFLYKVCGCRKNWTMTSFIQEQVEKIRKQVGRKKVICGLSGGVDSSVTSVLIQQAIGKQLTCIFVNNGLLRKNEAKQVMDTFSNHFGINLKYVDAEKIFISKLKNVIDPEKKRKIIGTEFIRIFEKAARELGDIEYLAQGTLYPDVIESISPHQGPSATIKSHHNVGGLPKDLKFKLIEPLRELFKDEVRQAGRELKIDEEILMRQPFPGPGLAVRILGAVTGERLDILKEADAIARQELRKCKVYKEIWQSFAVLLPVKTVGVMGDKRTYENVLVLRAVSSSDGMTADWVKIPYKTLGKISNRIINEVKGINRVCYDISSKPPSTIEWE